MLPMEIMFCDADFLFLSLSVVCLSMGKLLLCVACSAPLFATLSSLLTFVACLSNVGTVLVGFLLC